MPLDLVVIRTEFMGFSSATSTRRLPSNTALTVVGLIVGGIGAALLAFGGQWVGDITLSASDFLMVSNTGPQFGMRDDEGDIVLVHYGRTSAERLGTKPTVDTDQAVYEALLAADVKGIADARVITALLPEDFEPVGRPTLEMMAQLPSGEGRIVRDVMLGNMVDYETIRQYDDFIRHDSMGMRSPIDSSNHSRLSPIADHDLFVLRESMTLWLAQASQGNSSPLDTELKNSISQSGIAGTWLSLFPVMETLLEGCDAAPSPAPYQVGDIAVPWIPYESEWPQISPAAFWIDHTQRVNSIPVLSYGDVAESDFDPELVKDKLVVIGLDLDFVQSEQRFRLPSQREQVGNSVLIALAAQTIIDQRFLKALPKWGYLLPILLLAVITCLLVGRGTVMFAAASGLAMLLGYFVIAIIGFCNGWFTDMAITPSTIGLAAILTGAIRYGYEIRWRNRITDLFGRYVPRAVVADLISKRALESITVGGSRRQITVMFADIRGFTRFTEGNEPETVIDRLNEFLDVMVQCTFEQEGTVDKFIGDAILVLFNAPTDQPDHAVRAVRAAWQIQHRLSAMIETQGDGGLRIGIGIHTGEAIVGNVGTTQRMEYTAIGSTVNTASRLCDHAGGGEVVVSQEVADAVGDAFQWRANEPVQVKGIDRPLQTATLLGPMPEQKADDGTNHAGQDAIKKTGRT